MKKISILLSVGFCLGALCLGVHAEGSPKIQFEQTVYDLGKTSLVESVSGIFKFKNIGDGVLRLEPPKPSCGCTVATFKTNALAPGESGELAFTLNLGRSKTQMEKHIGVTSNDPLSPEISLIIKVDYTPLYDINPMTLVPNLAFGVGQTEQFTTIIRTDGKPLHIIRLDTSKPWISAQVEPGIKPEDNSARIRVTVKREGSPRHFNESVQIYAGDETNTPATSIFVYGQVMGEVALNPEALYWSITDSTNAPSERPEALVLRRLTIRSAAGQTLELKNPQSTIKGLSVELVSKEAGKMYELVARLDNLPTNTVSGNVSFETSLAAQPRIEVPVIVNVFKP